MYPILAYSRIFCPSSVIFSFPFKVWSSFFFSSSSPIFSFYFLASAPLLFSFFLFAAASLCFSVSMFAASLSITVLRWSCALSRLCGLLCTCYCRTACRRSGLGCVSCIGLACRTASSLYAVLRTINRCNPLFRRLSCLLRLFLLCLLRRLLYIFHSICFRLSCICL